MTETGLDLNSLIKERRLLRMTMMIKRKGRVEKIVCMCDAVYI